MVSSVAAAGSVVDVVVAVSRRRRIERDVRGHAVEPDVVGQDECEAAEDAIPRDALAECRGEGKRPLLTLGEHLLAEGLRLRRELMVGSHCKHGPRRGKGLLLAVDAAVGDKGSRDEREQDGPAADRGEEDECVRALAGLLEVLAGEKVDGAHQSSIPSPIATASAPSWPLELMPCPEPTRANGSATRTLMPISSSSCSASP